MEFSIEPTVETTTVTKGFTVTYTPEQFVYVLAVLGATVTASSIPSYAQGMYAAMVDEAETAGLVATGFGRERSSNAPHVSGLFQRLGLKPVLR